MRVSLLTILAGSFEEGFTKQKRLVALSVLALLLPATLLFHARPIARAAELTQRQLASVADKSKCFANKFGGRDLSAISNTMIGRNEFMANCYEWCSELSPVKPNESGWDYFAKKSDYDYIPTRDNRNCQDKWFKLLRRKGSKITVDQGTTVRLRTEGKIERYVSDFPVVIRCDIEEYSTGGTWRPIMPNTIPDRMASKYC